MASGSVAVTGTAADKLTQNVSRQGVHFQNTGSVKVYVAFGETAVAESTTFIPPASGDSPGWMTVEAGDQCTLAISMVATAGGTATVYYQTLP